MKSLLALACCVAASVSIASVYDLPRPNVQAVALQTPPVIDGQVANDPAWVEVPVTGQFTQVRPFAGQPASQATRIRIGYDADALYIAAECLDEDPSKIVVRDARRDAPLGDTDALLIIIDAHKDGQNGLVFATTPSGLEHDAQISQEGAQQNGDWDTSWSVDSQVNDRGWSTELRIPFSSLRYGNEPLQTWGINFQRNIRGNREVAFWAPLERQHNLFRVSEAGTLTNVQPPAQRDLVVTPYALFQAQRGGERAKGTHLDEEFGVDIKALVTPSLTLDVTINTDFAQVEADDLQVNLNRFSLFFPEKRLFFLENAGLFRVGTPREVELFFSRRIGIGLSGEQTPIDGGIRLSGKLGSTTNVGLLHMQTEGIAGSSPQNDFTVARVRQELPNRSSVGAIVVLRDGDGSTLPRAQRDRDYNRTYALDGRLGVGDNWTFEGYVAQSETPGQRGDDLAYRLNGSFSDERWSSGAGYTRVGENFNPEVGFLQRRDYEKVNAFVLRRIRPENWLGFYEIRPHISFNGYWDSDGFWESGFLHVDSHWEWRNGWRVHTGINFLHEGVKTPFEINRGTTIGVGEYDDHELDLVLQTDNSQVLSGSIEARIGGFFGGDRTQLTSTIQFKPNDKFSSELTWNHIDLDLPVANGHFDVNVARLRLSYAFTPKINLQALVQYDDRTNLLATNIRFAWLQTGKTGLYLVYNEFDDENVGRGGIEKRREFALKFSRAFDLI